MKNKCVLFFVNSLAGGGAERVCLNLATEYIEQGYSVEFVTPYDDDQYTLPPEINRLSLGLQINDSKIKKIIKLLFTIKEVNHFMSDKEYELITSHLPLSNLLARLSSCNRKCLYVVHSNVKDALPCKCKKIILLILKLLLRRRKVVAVSTELGNALTSKYKMNEKFVYSINNPLVKGSIMEMMKEPINYTKPFILFIGRLEEQKRVDRAINCFAKGGFGNKYDLVILGDGRLRRESETLIKALNVESSVNIMGWVKNPYKWMYNAELLLMTSDHEAFPMVLVESLLCNCPIVAGDCDFGTREILGSELSDYLVLDYQNDMAYIDKIKKCIEDKPNVENNSILKNCTIRDVAKNYLDVYK